MLPDYSVITSIVLGIGLAGGIAIAAISIFAIVKYKLKVNASSLGQVALYTMLGGFTVWFFLGLFLPIQNEEKKARALGEKFDNTYPAACKKAGGNLELIDPDGTVNYKICITGKRILLQPVIGIAPE